MKSNNGQFKKGTSGNSNGRPKSVINNHKRNFIEIQKLVADNALGVLKQLMEKVEAGESWAIQLFLQEILAIGNEERLSFKVDHSHPHKIEAVTEALLQTISTIREVTINDVCKLVTALSKLITALTSLKIAEVTLESKESIANLLTEEQYKTFKLWLADAEKRKFS